jgi:hypothetical protein
MGLIDEEQRPTDRLKGLVEKDTRRQALGEVLHDLYPQLLEKVQSADGEMADRDIVAFFRKETGMGNDSANKMKMFFKYLLSEAEVDGVAIAADSAAEPAAAETSEAEAPEPKEASTPSSGNGRRGEGRSAQAERRSQGRGGDRSERGERSERGDRAERGERSDRSDRSDRGDRDRDRGDRGDRERVPSNRPLTEAQRAYLDTLKSVLRVNVDGDWDDDMIRLAFDRLERLFDRVRRS